MRNRSLKAQSRFPDSRPQIHVPDRHQCPVLRARTIRPRILHGLCIEKALIKVSGSGGEPRKDRLGLN
jgi:hypothetical protein